MSRGTRSRARTTVLVVILLASGGCASDGHGSDAATPSGTRTVTSTAGTTSGAGSTTASSLPVGANAGPPVNSSLVLDGPPPTPTTRCLPQTPVELEVGPWLLGCMLTPTSWTVENNGPTIAQLSTRPGTSMPFISDISSNTPGAVDDVLGAVYARYRTTYTNGYFLLPGAKISVIWPGETPGVLVYTAAPAESVGLRLGIEGYNRAVSRGRPTTASDVIGCISGMAETASTVADGSAVPTTQTWNVVVDNGFNVLACAELVPEDDRALAKRRVREGAVALFDEVGLHWRQWFQVVLKG